MLEFTCFSCALVFTETRTPEPLCPTYGRKPDAERVVAEPKVIDIRLARLKAIAHEVCVLRERNAPGTQVDAALARAQLAFESLKAARS